MLTLTEYLEKQGIGVDLLQELGVYTQVEQEWQNLKTKKDLVAVSSNISAKILQAVTKNDPFIQLHLKEDEINQESEDVSEEEEDTLSTEVVLRPTVINGKKIESVIEGSDTINDMINKLRQDTLYTVVDISKKEMRIKPKAPFTTSTLQQAASSRLGFNPKLTMQIAQKLYEGVDLDGKSTALITYMRTDSVILSNDVLATIKGFIQSNYPKFDFSGSRVYKSKSKNAQEAHEAIRPTNPLLTPDSLKHKLDSKQWKVYDLIWRQTVASQMADEIREITTFELENSLKSRFQGSKTLTTFLGWKAVFKS
jgi:DNA topoisomerase I